MNNRDFIYNTIYKAILDRGIAMNIASQYASNAIEKYDRNKYSMNGGVMKMIKEQIKQAVKYSKK